MHDDVTDAVDAALRARMVDADRIAIVALLSAAIWRCARLPSNLRATAVRSHHRGPCAHFTSSATRAARYRCAVTIAGVFDWARVIEDSSRNEHQRGRYGFLRRRLGDPEKDAEAFDAISPIRAVDQIKIPVFVAHGTLDHVASVGESKRLIAALKKRGLAFESRITSGEGHGFNHLENNVRLYSEIEDFLTRHMAKR